MITLKEFIKEVETIELEFNYQQIKDIYNAIVNTVYDTIDGLKEDFKENGIMKEFTIYHDTNIISLIENLIDFKGNEQYITDMCNSYYGQVIELYYLEHDEQYIMAIGNR